MERSLDLGGQIISIPRIFYQRTHQARWTRSHVLYHWIHDCGLLHQASSTKTVNKVTQGHHEPQKLSKILDHRSVLVYNPYLVFYHNDYLVNYHLAELLFKQFQIIIFVHFMFLYKLFKFITIVQYMKRCSMEHINKYKIVHIILE